MTENEGDHIDQSQWVNWSESDPMIKPERVAQGDVITGQTCETCDGTGREKYEKKTCSSCFGRGWNGQINAMEVKTSDIRFAQIQVRNILNYLWETGRITDENHDDGHTFEAWRNQHRVAMGFQKAVSSDVASSVGTKLRAYGYILLVRKLSVYDCKAVVKAIDTFSTMHSRTIAENERKIYSRAFERLTIAFKPIREQVTFLEELSDEERAQLGEGRMKSFLDRIHRNA